jgi:steroid delta-isomerase-like uncharacterized protein
VARTPRETVLAWAAAFDARDAEAAASLYHPDAVNTQFGDGVATVGREAILADLRAFFAAFPDSYTHVEAVHEAGEWAMVEWSGGATWLGPFAGRAPTGRRFTLRGCGFFHVIDGLIRTQRGYHNTGHWFDQIGFSAGEGL